MAATEILLYEGIFDFTAERFMKDMEEAKDDDITLRISTDGGDPQQAFGMIAKFQEHEGTKSIKVDGKAFSMGAFFLLYTNDVEALDVSEFLFHRAAFPRFIEQSEDLFTDSDKERLAKLNASLRKAMEAKLDIPRFEKITGVTLDELFSMESRIDVTLTAKQAKQVKLINRIIPITPEIKASVNNKMLKIAANMVVDLPKEEEEEIQPQKNTEMDLNKLKAEHPALYSQVVNIGAEQEKDRAGAWLAFADVDLKTVSEGIKGSEAMSATMMAELTRKSFSAQMLTKTEEEAIEDIDTAEINAKAGKKKTKEEEKVVSFVAEVRSNLGLKDN